MVLSKVGLAVVSAITFAFPQASDASLGIDVSTSVTSSTWSCMANAGYNYAIVRGYLSYGAVDTNAIGTLENAKAAGFEYRDIYAFPCRGLDASTQMVELVTYLEANGYVGGRDYNYVWLDLESNPKTSCYWSTYSGTSNCEYVQELIDTLESYNVPVGIYSSYYNWELIFDSTTACTDFTSYPLWYAHYDDDASFDSWNDIPFGGWTTPSMKQYVGDDVLCSTGVDYNYAPSSFFNNYYGGGGSSTGDCTNPQTAGGVSVSFAASGGGTLTSIESCDDNYDDPNNMGVYLFSQALSGSSASVGTNFALSEFASPGDDYLRLMPELVECVQAVRSDIAESLYIDGAYRTVSQNSAVSGASSSRHLSGSAADIYAGSASVTEVAFSAICNCKDIFADAGYKIGLGLADTFVHVDARSSDASWTETGSGYSATEWATFIEESYSSCDSGSVPTIDDDDDGGNVNSDGSIQFPNVALNPISSSDWRYVDPNYSGSNLFSQSDAGASTSLSDNFAVNEFTSNDGADGFRLIPELVECLQAVREDLGVTLNVNSGYRSVYWNGQVGGASSSRHMSGTAADIQQYTYSIYSFADSVICNCRSIFINAGQEIGLGLGAAYLHVDMRPYHTYWIYGGAPLSTSGWGSYISNTYSSCSSKGYSVASLSASNDTAQADVNEDQNHDDIDEEEDASDSNLADDDSGSDDDESGLEWWIIALIVAAVLILCVGGGCFGYKRYQKHVADNAVQYSSGYTKVDA